MTGPKAIALAQIVQAAAVVASLVFVSLELRQSNELQRASNALRIQEMASPFNLELVRNPDFARFWLVKPDDLSRLDQTDVYRHTSLVTWWLLLHESIFYQHKKGLLDDDVFCSWQADLKSFAKKKLQKGSRDWQTLRPVLDREFALQILALRDSGQTVCPPAKSAQLSR